MRFKSFTQYSLAVAFAASLVSAPAQALLVGTSASVFSNGAIEDSDSETSGVSAFSVASSITTNANASASSSASGQLQTLANTGEIGVASATSGSSFGAFSVPTPTGASSASSQATWTDTITNNDTNIVGYRWLFQVTNPRLGNGFATGDYAALDIDILLDNAVIWEGFAELENCMLNTSNINLTLSQFNCFASGPSFTIGVDLGDYAPGDSFRLDYVMTAFADSADPDLLSPTFAGIGDPFNPDTTAFGRVEVVRTGPPTAVPIPTPILLLITGLAALRIGRKR